MTGKSERSQTVKDAMEKYKAVYLGAIGGAGALLSKKHQAGRSVAYENLGTEALLRL